MFEELWSGRLLGGHCVRRQGDGCDAWMDELGRTGEVIDAKNSEARGHLLYLLLGPVHLACVEQLLDGDQDLLANGNQDVK